MNTCEACGSTKSKDSTFYKLPQDKEHLQQWITNMGKAEGWSPPESSVLCSAHFSPDCFNGTAHLCPAAIPTIFSAPECTDTQDSKEPGNVTNERGTPVEVLDTHRSRCDCEERLQAIEKSYKLKLVTAQLQIKKYQKELAEQSHKAMKWQRKVIVLQSALKALKLKRSVSSSDKSATSEKRTDHAEDRPIHN